MSNRLNELIRMHNEAHPSFEKFAKEALESMKSPSIERTYILSLLGSDNRAKQNYEAADYWQRLVIRDLESLRENNADRATIETLLSEAKEDLQLTKRTWGSRYPARPMFPLIATHAG